MGIFRNYDVRGVYGKDIDEDVMKRIGAAFAEISSNTIVIASDGRTSSPALKGAFISGAGKDVIDAGAVPLGVGMLHALGKYDYAYITASHLPKEWNGVKFFHKSGIGFSEFENKRVEEIFSGATQPAREARVIPAGNVLDNYSRYVFSKVLPKRKLKVVLDCGNGMAGVAARQLFASGGFDASAIFDKVDGDFPGRNPDPSEDELVELRRRVIGADIGIAYDGDGDRMVIVDETGRKLTPEQTSYLILLGALNHNGPVVANVECTRMVDDVVGKFGKKVIRIPVGHTHLMNAVQQHAACFGVEVSGHYALSYMAPFDDSLMISFYAACVLSGQSRKLSEIVDEVRTYPFERINVECDDDRKFSVVERLKKSFRKEYINVNTMDGVRADFNDGWILVRASNTSPYIRLTVEANDERRLAEMKKEFMGRLGEEISQLS